jgi:Tfp pilus assembly protein FimT
MVRTRAARGQRGASLIEAILAMSIAGVLTTSAVASPNNVMTQQRLRASSSDLCATFNLARSEATKRSSPVAVIPAGATDWSTGWKVFADRNDNGIRDADEETIVERPAPAKGVSTCDRVSASRSPHACPILHGRRAVASSRRTGTHQRAARDQRSGHSAIAVLRIARLARGRGCALRLGRTKGL